MRGVILHGGHGTRLRPLSYAGPKQLIPVANKPVSQYALEDLASIGVRDIAIILGETFPNLVREHYGNGRQFGVNITYIHQGYPKGIAHAIGLCERFVGDDSFVVYLGDNILQDGIKKYAEDFLNSSYDAMLLFKEVEDPTRFGVGEFDRDGKLIRLVEKPRVPPSKYALVGVYFLTPVIFKMIRRLKPSWRGEYEITEALQMLIDEGYNVGYRLVKGWWLDTGKKDDVLYANALVLRERVSRQIRGEVVNSELIGEVSIDEETKVINSVIRGPAVVGRGCLIENSFIGPYTSIGDKVKIVDSAVEYSVVLNSAEIRGVRGLRESLIGKYAKVVKSDKPCRLHIADYSEVLF